MFEKEAEEYIKEHSYFDEEFGLISLDVTSKTAFQDGAEFGYKEGIKTLDDMTRAFNREHKKYTDLRIANEWHYVKDGDLPEDDRIVLFYTTYFDFWIGGIEPKNDKKHRWEVLPSVSGDYYAEDEVIAWKEIVLPKESE